MLLLAVRFYFPSSCTLDFFALQVQHSINFTSCCNELHNNVTSRTVRKYVLSKMLITIKGCTFQFPLNLFTYVCMPFPFSFLPPNAHTHRKWRYPLSRPGFQHSILVYHFFKAAFQALQWPTMKIILLQSSLFLASSSLFLARWS